MPNLALLGGEPELTSSESLHRSWPIIEAEDRSAVDQVLSRGILSGPFGPEVSGLQTEFAEYLGVEGCLTTASGTSALYLALAGLGIKEGDEVLCPAFTFVATALAVLQTGAKPVFVDIEDETWGLDPDLMEAAITPRTKAVIPVHIHGTPCRIQDILMVAQKHNLFVVEDACQAHGATYRGKPVGSFGDFAAFSLQSSKNLACGEGGLLVAKKTGAAFDRANASRNFGEPVLMSDREAYEPRRAMDLDRAYETVTMGGMHRLSEMSAALARSQLKRLDHWNANGRENAETLNAHIGVLPGLRTPVVPEDCEGVYHKYRVAFNPDIVGVDLPAVQVREYLIRALRAEGVEACTWQTKPVPEQGFFRDLGYEQGAYPKTTYLLEHSLCLFSHTFPIYCQSEELAQAYGRAFEKVWKNLKEGLQASV